MKQIDFENGKITDNILRASVPMLVAEVLSLLYNIVDRIYSRCGNYRPRIGRTLFPDHHDHSRFQQSLWFRRRSAFFHRTRTER